MTRSPASARSNCSSRPRALFVRLGAVQSAQAPDHHEVLTSCQHLVEGRVLSGDTDVAPDLGRLGDDVEAGDARTTPVRDGERRQDADGGGLSCTVRPEHAEDRAGGNLEIDPGEGDGPAEALLEALGLDHRVGRHGSAPVLFGSY